MNRLSILALTIAMTCCLAGNFYFELQNDPNYPALLSVSNVQYNVVTGLTKHIDVSATVTIHEEINDGTSVSISNIALFFSSVKRFEMLQLRKFIHFIINIIIAMICR